VSGREVAAAAAAVNNPNPKNNNLEVGLEAADSLTAGQRQSLSVLLDSELASMVFGAVRFKDDQGRMLLHISWGSLRNGRSVPLA
jgi:hypothetical protein